MLLPRAWQSNAALSMTTTMTIASSLLVPVLLAHKAAAVPYAAPIQLAQRFPDSWRTDAIPAGTAIPVRYDKAERIVLTPDETVPVTLTVTDDVLTNRGTVLIPSGSEISGELQPSEGGTQFVASQVLLADDREVAIDATSNVVTRTETINRRSNPDILKGAAIGGAAAAVLSEVLGDIDVLEVLGGAGLGALGSVVFRGSREVEVVVVEPETDIDLRLQSDFTSN
ncbi:hypothetical protein IFO70_04240 [Phormidium tenue FACHB-886]|nr:hypothetical protein [Phormidium tenue FACHB-886]